MHIYPVHECKIEDVSISATHNTSYDILNKAYEVQIQIKGKNN